MSRFIRTAVVTLATLPGLFLLGGTAAFARTDDPAADPGTVLPAPVPPAPDTISFADRVQWMGAGAGILLALIVVSVTALALVRRHQQRAGQLRTT